MGTRVAHDITELYAPQFEQFGIRLAGIGPVSTGEVATAKGSGSAWIMPVSPTCLVMEHFITPAEDMMLAEFTPEPYACVSEISTPTLECMPAAGITPANLAPARSTCPETNVCSFIQSNCGVEMSPLLAGRLYHSRSVVFLPGYFDDLEQRYPHQFNGLFDAFARPWGEEASLAIADALGRFSERRSLAAGGHLFTRSIVDGMVSELAASLAAEATAEIEDGSPESKRLAAAARTLIERACDQGKHIGIDEIARRLYVSRSKLCAVFKQQTGESVGAFARRRRVERACDLLAESSLSLAEIAQRLGYPRQSAFTQAFKRETGLAPSAWREQR